jgi:hypothetical protein
MMANREYFVIDAEGFTSSSNDGKQRNDWIEPEPEAFSTLKVATARARKLAESEPGRTVVITRAIAYVTCPVLKPKVEIRKL